MRVVARRPAVRPSGIRTEWPSIGHPLVAQAANLVERIRRARPVDRVEVVALVSEWPAARRCGGPQPVSAADHGVGVAGRARGLRRNAAVEGARVGVRSPAGGRRARAARTARAAPGSRPHAPQRSRRTASRPRSARSPQPAAAAARPASRAAATSRTPALTTIPGASLSGGAGGSGGTSQVTGLRARRRGATTVASATISAISTHSRLSAAFGRKNEVVSVPQSPTNVARESADMPWHARRLVALARPPAPTPGTRTAPRGTAAARAGRPRRASPGRRCAASCPRWMPLTYVRLPGCAHVRATETFEKLSSPTPSTGLSRYDARADQPQVLATAAAVLVVRDALPGAAVGHEVDRPDADDREDAEDDRDALAREHEQRRRSP